MFEVQFLIPRVDNEGNAFVSEDFALFERVLINHFGGFTKYPGMANGGWVEDGRLYRDETFVYGVALSLEGGNRAVRSAKVARLLFRQRAIFIRYLGVTEIIE